MKKIGNLLLLILIGYWGWKFFDWALVKAVWQPDPQACRAASGACWGFIVEKHRLIAFGTYPYEEHWRPAIASLLLIALWVVTAMRRRWWVVAAWMAGLVVIGILMWGGVLGLPYVENERWGGLVLTLLLTTFGLAFAFPLGILLALGRRSELPLIRALCIAYIELIRGVPLISVLFMASVMLPLFLPSGVSIDKLLRAQVALILFAAAYLAEVVRGGLQAIPRHQYEAADALGFSYFQKTFLVVLPQALRIAVPPLVGTCIGFFKDTSLVLIIGIFDFLNTANQALVDPNWAGFPAEVYLFAAFVYFCFCFSMSRYSKYLEVELNKGTRR